MTGEIVIYQHNGEIKLEITLDNDTLWLTQAQMIELYETSKANLSEHIKNIFDEEELDKTSTVRKFRTVQTEGNRKVKREIDHYNLDMIIAVGYRIKSKIATRFRIWATQTLKEYIIKGFALDDDRLKELGGGKYWKELLDRIRDIRSSEKTLYRQVLDLYATSIDYQVDSKTTKEFFKIAQNKLHFLAHGHTAAEIISERADPGKPFMGLLSFGRYGVSKKDITIAKNYLNEDELETLNTAVSTFFDVAEFRAKKRIPSKMSDYLILLDKLATVLDTPALTNSGNISHSEVEQKALIEYEIYTKAEQTEIERAYLAHLKEIENTIEP